MLTLDYNCCVLTKQLINRLSDQSNQSKAQQRLVEDTRNTICMYVVVSRTNKLQLALEIGEHKTKDNVHVVC